MESNLPIEPGSNWAGNYRYKAMRLYHPQTVAEIQDLVKKLDKVKALGSRHCFNGIADSSSAQISTESLDQVDIDQKGMTVTLGSGLRYGQFCSELDVRGFALHNLASLPHISVVGACATATHGSGMTNRNLGASVSALEIVSGTGELVTLNRNNGDLLSGAIVNLGALGVVTKISLDIEKSFSVRQDVFQNLPLGELKDNFDEVMSSGYSVSLFTDWQDQSIDQVWIKRRSDGDTKPLPNRFFGAIAASEQRHPLPGISAANCTEQMGVAGPWYERLPHFKMGFTPSRGDELQSEYFVSRQNAVDAISAIEKKSDLIGPHLLVSEIRTIAADHQWLSTCYKQDTVAIHFTWKPNLAEVNNLLPVIEAELAPFDARPHWGKLFTTSPKVLRTLYEKLPDFVELLRTYDPHGKFRNDFLDKYIYGVS